MPARPPVVTILGHVDHGKTTLLDYIRRANVAAKEHGGITQKIGAYSVKTGIKGYHTDEITFIDTPGHEAYSKLRARGADVADVALLIIDAKDSLKPQTLESISHIKAGNLPFIVVFNKTDLPEANIEKVKIDLMKADVLVEDKGGTVVSVSISAKSGNGVPNLLEAILLLTSDLNLTYDPAGPAEAYIIETKKDKRGIVGSAIIKNGRFSVGETIYTNEESFKIRALSNDFGQSISEVLPSTPFELTGFTTFPEVGTAITDKPQEASTATLEAAIQKIADPNVSQLQALFGKKEDAGNSLSLLIKADLQGSLEAIIGALNKQNVTVVLGGVGQINQSDIFLAKTTGSIVIGFNIVPDNGVTTLAKQEKVIIKTYNLIYELLEELTEVADLLKEKEEKNKNLKGEAKIQATFVIDGNTVYGVRVTKGKAKLGDPIELYRGDQMLGSSKLVSLQLRAKSTLEVKKDQEAGMSFAPRLDIKVGDMVKFVL